jgi:hypothetical protein
VEIKKLKIKYIPIVDITADRFTKPLDCIKFNIFKDHLGIVTKLESV